MSTQASDLRQYMRAIRRRSWVVAAFVAIAVMAAYVSVGRAPARYKTSATLLVTAPVITPSPSAQAGGEIAQFRPDALVVTNDVIALMASRPIAARVAARLNLPGPATVQNALKAEAVRGTSLVRVSGSARDPELAARLANTAAQEFIGYFRETNRASVAETRRFVEDQLAIAGAKLEASERSIESFRRTRQIPSVAQALTHSLSAMATGQAALDAARTARHETDARLTAARARLGREQPTVVASRAVTENPVFRQIQARLVDLEIQRVQLSQIYTPQHPKLEALNREIGDLRTRLRAEAQTTVGQEITAGNPIHARLLGDVVTLEVDSAAVAARVEGLAATQRRLQAVAMSMPNAEIQESRLMREHRVLESNYMTLSTRYQEMLLRENQAGFFPASVQVVEAAAPPLRPTPSPFPTTAAAAGLAGLVLGIAAALFLEEMDDRIRGAQDAERVLGVPVLAQIPAQGAVRAAPATAVFTIILVLAALMAAAVFMRGYAAAAKTAVDGIKSVAVYASRVSR